MRLPLSEGLFSGNAAGPSHIGVEASTSVASSRPSFSLRSKSKDKVAKRKPSLDEQAKQTTATPGGRKGRRSRDSFGCSTALQMDLPLPSFIEGEEMSQSLTRYGFAQPPTSTSLSPGTGIATQDPTRKRSASLMQPASVQSSDLKLAAVRRHDEVHGLAGAPSRPADADMVSMPSCDSIALFAMAGSLVPPPTNLEAASRTTELGPSSSTAFWEPTLAKASSHQTLRNVANVEDRRSVDKTRRTAADHFAAAAAAAARADDDRRPTLTTLRERRAKAPLTLHLSKSTGSLRSSFRSPIRSACTPPPCPPPSTPLPQLPASASAVAKRNSASSGSGHTKKASLATPNLERKAFDWRGSHGLGGQRGSVATSHRSRSANNSVSTSQGCEACRRTSPPAVVGGASHPLGSGGTGSAPAAQPCVPGQPARAFGSMSCSCSHGYGSGNSSSGRSSFQQPRSSSTSHTAPTSTAPSSRTSTDASECSQPRCASPPFVGDVGFANAALVGVAAAAPGSVSPTTASSPYLSPRTPLTPMDRDLKSSSHFGVDEQAMAHVRSAMGIKAHGAEGGKTPALSVEALTLLTNALQLDGMASAEPVDSEWIVDDSALPYLPLSTAAAAATATAPRGGREGVEPTATLRSHVGGVPPPAHVKSAGSKTFQHQEQDDLFHSLLLQQHALHSVVAAREADDARTSESAAAHHQMHGSQASLPTSPSDSTLNAGGDAPAAAAAAAAAATPERGGGGGDANVVVFGFAM